MGELTPIRLVLASGSPRRAALLRRLGWHAEIRPADVNESVEPGEAAEELVRRLARSKAAAVARGDEDEVVLAADTEVVLDGQVLGKPTDEHHAARMLRSLAGRTHQVMTGLAARRGRLEVSEVVTTHVTFRALDEGEVAWYVATGEPTGKAGSYALQGAGAALVDRIEGSDTNVIGLPMAATVEVLRTLGLDLLDGAQLASR